MDDRKIIERGRQSLNFIEQLQNQIQLCREAISDTNIPLTPKIQALEGLLWAKLKEDNEYLDIIKKIDLQFKEDIKALKKKYPSEPEWRINEMTNPYLRKRSREQFKAIMVFIDQKGLMPIGNENE